MPVGPIRLTSIGPISLAPVGAICLAHCLPICLQTDADDGIVVLVGLTHVQVKVGNPANGRKSQKVRCLVDSGAIYSLVPAAVLKRLGISPHSTREFVLANGEVVSRKLATATFEYQGHRGDSMVIVGEPGDAALLGATTLEGFGLVLDPFRRELRPLQLTLKRSA